MSRFSNPKDQEIGASINFKFNESIIHDFTTQPEGCNSGHLDQDRKSTPSNPLITNLTVKLIHIWAQTGSSGH